MRYILGFRNDIPLNIVEETKVYLEKLWNKEWSKLEFKKLGTY